MDNIFKKIKDKIKKEDGGVETSAELIEIEKESIDKVEENYSDMDDAFSMQQDQQVSSSNNAVKNQKEPLQKGDIYLIKTGLYSTKNALYNVLLSKKIDRVSQILDDDLMKEVRLHTSKRYLNHLNIFIDMIKCKYAGIPLPQVAIFDKPLLTSDELDACYFHFGPVYNVTANRNSLDIHNFSYLSERNIFSIAGNDEYIIKKNMSSLFEFAVQYGYLNEQSTYIEFFEFAMSDDNKWFKFKEVDKNIFKFYIEQYKKQKEENLSDEELLISLRTQLESLMKSRDNLDNQIAEINEKIEQIQSGMGSM